MCETFALGRERRGWAQGGGGGGGREGGREVEGDEEVGFKAPNLMLCHPYGF